ncbi:hypothetical protein CMUS01_12654, partial [Colletotrichum musicola]
GTCSKQERLVQKNLNSHHPHYQPSPRPLWIILLCCLPSEPPSPSQSRKRCPTETWTEEVERLCPRCQTIRDAPSLVPGRAPAAANSNTRFDAGVSPAKPAAVAKRNWFVGDRHLHPVGRPAHTDRGAGQSSSSSGGHRHHVASSSSRSGRQQPPQKETRPRRDTAGPRPQDSTANLRPSPLRVAQTESSQVPPSLERINDSNSNNSNDSSTVKPTKKKRKVGRSAVEGMSNPPMSVLVEDVEKTWGSGSGSSSSSTPSTATSEQAPYTPYTPELPLDELFEEVELMWQRGVEPPSRLQEPQQKRQGRGGGIPPDDFPAKRPVRDEVDSWPLRKRFGALRVERGPRGRKECVNVRGEQLADDGWFESCSCEDDAVQNADRSYAVTQESAALVRPFSLPTCAEKCRQRLDAKIQDRRKLGDESRTCSAHRAMAVVVSAARVWHVIRPEQWPDQNQTEQNGPDQTRPADLRQTGATVAIFWAARENAPAGAAPSIPHANSVVTGSDD